MEVKDTFLHFLLSICKSGEESHKVDGENKSRGLKTKGASRWQRQCSQGGSKIQTDGRDDAATSIDGVSSEAERSTAGKASALLLAICKHSLLSLFRYTHERMSFYVADLGRHIVTLYADGLLGVSQSRKILLGFRGSLDIRRT